VNERESNRESERENETVMCDDLVFPTVESMFHCSLINQEKKRESSCLREKERKREREKERTNTSNAA
jgi:hypothetical protein